MHYSVQDLLWVIGSLSKVFRIPFDPQLILQQFPPPYSRTALLNILQKLDFKVGVMELDGGSIAALERLPFPAIAFLRAAGHPAQVDERDAPQAKTLSPVLLVKADAGRVLYFRAGSEQPETLPLSELAQHIRTDILLVAREAAQVVDEGGDESAPSPSGNATGQPPFGFRWFIPELLRHKRIWRDILIASFFIQLVGLVTPLFTQVIIDKVVVHQTQSTLIAIAAGLVMFMLFNSAMTWLRQYFVLHTGNRIDAVLGSQVFRHLLHLPIPYFERRPTGTLVARMHGVETVREFVSGAAVTLLLDFPFLLIFVAVMFWYSWQLTLIALLLLSCIAAASVAVTPAFRKKLDHQFLLGARNQAFLTEYVAGMETVKSLQMEPVLEQRYGEFLASYLAASFSTRQLSNTYNVIANALEQIMTLSILVAGALLVMQNDGFTIGMLVAFQMFASRMSQPMLRLAGLWQEFQQADVAVKRLGDLMDAPAEPYALTPARARNPHLNPLSEMPSPQSSPACGRGGERERQSSIPAGGRIEFCDISFRYSDKHPYLFQKLNLVLAPGKLTALMGPSGCGKSTLAKMLQGFYWPTDGSILLDGYDIRHLSANELRAHFGVVPQETRLFSGTIYDNLQLANPHAGFEEIVRACTMAEIHHVIERLPQGYQTPVGEQGVGLSGGQRQRIAIARALLKHPRILIFDEAVSSLDQQTAEHFAHTVNKLKGRVTMLFITHQMPDALQVDEVIRFGAPL